MPIFKENPKGKLKKLNSFSASKEKEVQKLVEDNLMEVLDMHFLATEYTTTFGGRIDTLAIDVNGAPVIIEYKRNRNDSIINQGLSYLKWLKAQKQEFFEMLVLKNLGEKVAKAITVDWKNPRVVCIAENYSQFDIDTVEVVPMRIELFKYRYYDEGIFSLEPLGVSEKTVSTGSNGGSAEVVKSKIDFIVNDHVSKASPKVQEIFAELRSRIFELDDNIVEKATSMYVAYRVAKNFAEVHIGKNQIKIHLRPIEYEDPQNRIEKVPEAYQWVLDRRIYLKEEKELDYVFGIIEQSYNDVI